MTFSKYLLLVCLSTLFTFILLDDVQVTIKHSNIVLVDTHRWAKLEPVNVLTARNAFVRANCAACVIVQMASHSSRIDLRNRAETWIAYGRVSLYT